MSSENIELLNEESFFSKLVPYFEEMKSKLFAVLGKDRKWEKLLTHLYLICDVNGELQLLRDSNRHLFLLDSSQIGSFLNDNTYYSIRVKLRMLFNEEVVSRLTPRKIGSYIRRILGNYYFAIEEIETSNYIRFRFTSINTSDALLLLHPYKTNVVIPKGAILDATETVGWIGIDHRGGIDKTVLVTNKKDIAGYKNFDTVLDFRHLRNYLLAHFTTAISLYRDVLGITYEEFFDIVDLIGVSSEPETFWLQRQLLSLPLSDWRTFEECMRQFLTVCFKPYLPQFELYNQLPDREELIRRDFIIVNNRSTSEFLKYLMRKEGVRFLLFDAKSYEDKFTPRDIDTFRRYLNDNPDFGDFGIILSREGASENCRKSIYKSLASRHPVKIIVLDQDDLMLMLDYALYNGPALNVIETKYNKLSLEL